MHNTKIARRLRTRIGRFSGDLSKGLCIRAQRFVSEMVYGIQVMVGGELVWRETETGKQSSAEPAMNMGRNTQKIVILYMHA